MKILFAKSASVDSRLSGPTRPATALIDDPIPAEPDHPVPTTQAHPRSRHPDSPVRPTSPPARQSGSRPDPILPTAPDYPLQRGPSPSRLPRFRSDPRHPDGPSRPLPRQLDRPRPPLPRLLAPTALPFRRANPDPIRLAFPVLSDTPFRSFLARSDIPAHA